MKKIVTFRVEALIKADTREGFDNCVVSVLKQGIHLNFGGTDKNGNYSCQTRKTKFHSWNKVKEK